MPFIKVTHKLQFFPIKRAQFPNFIRIKRHSGGTKRGEIMVHSLQDILLKKDLISDSWKLSAVDHLEMGKQRTRVKWLAKSYMVNGPNTTSPNASLYSCTQQNRSGPFIFGIDLSQWLKEVYWQALNFYLHQNLKWGLNKRHPNLHKNIRVWENHSNDQTISNKKQNNSVSQKYITKINKIFAN